jgi:hypothetical protein
VAAGNRFSAGHRVCSSGLAIGLHWFAELVEQAADPAA